MNERDEDIELDLNALIATKPTELELQRWKRAASIERMAARYARNSSTRRSVHFAAAGLIGFLVGWIVFGTGLSNPFRDTNIVADSRNGATVEFIYSN